MITDKDTIRLADTAVSEETDRDIVAAYQPPEDVLNTPDLVGGAASQNRLLERKLQSELERTYGETAQQEKAEEIEELEGTIAQWRINRGAEYVAAYKALKQTGANIATGQAVFESDWFRDLQEGRAKEIADLKNEEKESGLSVKKKTKLEALVEDHEGDERVSRNWKRISDDYQQIKNLENKGGLTATEILRREAELKQRFTEELDNASPELRTKLLGEIGKKDPSFVKEYHAGAPEREASIASNMRTVRSAENLGNSSSLAVNELAGDLIDASANSSVAKKYGFSSVSAESSRTEFNTAACGSLSSAGQKIEEPVLKAKNTWNLGS